MKGKTKVLLKTIISALALLLASVGLFNLFNRKEKVYAAVTVASEEFSAKDTNNIILSVEKVAVAKDYTQEIAGNQLKSFLAPNEKTYYYADIANGDKPKTVVENNKYVMLNNNATENNHYYNSYITNIRDSQNVIKMSEAIMFTFGAYVYDADSEHVYRNAEGKSSLIQYINLEVYKGGVKMPTTDFTVRQYQIDNEFYQDFVYVLEQADVGSDTSYNDGYYTFKVDYRLPGGNMQTQTFSFYLIYESSYTNVYTPEGKDYFYTAKPTLSVYGGALNSDGNNINHYRLGDNKNYPTLIYDYTKYVVGYTYTANGKRSTYDYTYTTEVVAGGLKKYLVCDITSSGEKLEPVVYNLTSSNNLAVITFTEVGTYNFTFNYIYTGDNKDEAPDITESLTIDGALLQIHGFEAKYSKDGYDEAQLRYLTLSTDEVDNVDLIVPNGYLKDTRPATDALQVVYSTSSSSTARVGNIVAQEDALMNTHLDTNLKNFTDALTGAEAWDDTIQGMINGLEYVKTNQNSVWFNTNDALYSEKQGTLGEEQTKIPSYYFYNKVSPENFKIGERKQYNNTVSFVDPGYYLVLIKVKLDYTIDSHEQSYYQVFAFQITAKTIVANLTKQTSATEIGSDKFTNENIVVTWEQPATFERQISAQYYVSKNANVSEETLLAGTPHPISSGAVIGEDVAKNEFAKYIVEIKSEGEASINHTITIDRQDISNIGLYEVETIASGTSRYNVIRQTEHGYAQVTDLISDSAVTVYWNNKLSGANITAKYWRWDFAENKMATVSNVFGDDKSAESWFNNKYQLSNNVTGPITSISKANSLDAEVPSKYVYRNNGVYLFELTDAAGNSCYYMFVVDSTPAYLKVENEFVNAQAKLFATAIDVEASTHKAIKMFGADALTETASQLVAKINGSEDGKEILGSFIKLAGFATDEVSSFKNAGFYNSDREIKRLQTMFSKQPGEEYLIVKNMYMYAYDSEQHPDSNLYLDIQNAASRKKHISDVAVDTTSTVRNLYIIGENQMHQDDVMDYAKIKSSSSYVVVEINSDNSMGTVYYSGNPITDDIISRGLATRLYTGNNIQGAHATDANYVAFVWTFGSGAFEIKSITYDYYALNTASFVDSNVSVEHGGVYYYTTFGGTYSIFDDNIITNGGVFNEGTQGYAVINQKNNQTQPGLYVVTRTYVNPVEEGADVTTRQYYFIVDRNGIVSSAEANFAKNINISMLGGEDRCNEFESVGYTTARFSYDNPQTGIREEDNTQYTIYLSTSKLPAQINIPVGKYFNFGSDGRPQGSTYYAGKLQFSVYYVDRYSQLAKRENTTIKLFSVDLEETQVRNGYYVLDLSQVPFAYRNFFLQAGNNKDWICLPGDYIVTITDNVENANIARPKEYIGFRIVEAVAPQIEIQAALNDKASYNVISSNNNFDIVTSAEIVEFTLPVFDNSNDYAQVDIDYLVVEQHYNGGFRYFINYPYNAQGGERLDVDSEHVKNNYNDASKLVSRTISLDTKLVRDASGKVDVTKLDIPLYYTITIRYKLSNSASMRGDEFASCYYYYANGNKVEYYESTYTISIDRVAPTNNIKYLEEHDALAKYYYAEGKASLFAQTVTENNSGLYFANTYINRDLQNLYAFVVTDQTPFDTTDIAAVYYNVFENVGDLHWAPSQIPDGRQANLYGVTTFGDLNFGEYSTYVEILELDKAGNTAQYLVYYCTSDETDGGGYNISDSYFNVKLTIGARQYTSTGLDDKDTELTFNVHDVDKTFTVYSVRADSEFGNIYRGSNETFYYFALIDLHTSQAKFVYKTNGKTNFSGLEVPTAIVNGIEAAGPGNYKFVILTQDARKNYSAIFDYYSSTDYSIDAKDLVSTDRTTITLNKANKVIDNITYYAREIRINENGVVSTYKCVPENGQYNYYLYDASQGKTVGNPVVDIRTKKDTTYQLTTIDVFGDISNYRFSTAEGGDEFIKIESTSPMFEFSQVYYAFDATTIKFDTNIYTVKISYKFNDLSYDLPIDSPQEEISDDRHLIVYNKTNGTITLLPYKEVAAGARLEVKVEFYYNGTLETTYNVVVDSNTENVVLRDINNVGHEMKFNYNVGPDFYDVVTDFGVSNSGTMNLGWTHMADSHYTYNYKLHEILNDGSIKITEVDDVTNKPISTTSMSSGKYYFEIIVHSNPRYTDGVSLYVGNKVYAFAVKAIPSELYYVENEHNEAIAHNSTFKATDIPDVTSQDLALLPKDDMPLYISNGEMHVVYDSTQGISLHIFYQNDNLGGGYSFTVYEVRTATYSIYLGLLQTPKTETIISNSLRYDTKNWDALTSLEEIYVTKQDVNLKFTPRVSGRLQLKNLVLLDVYYNGQFVKTFTPSLNGRGNYTLAAGEYNYLIKGSGEYVFAFRDLAGNKHVFNALYEALPSDYISLTVLREIVVTVENNENVTAPIDNAYYNGEVKVSVYNETIYGSNLISLTATRNNSTYVPSKSAYVYRFTQPGTYRLKFSVNYEGTTLTKTLVFTIINPNECRENINLTTIAGYTITKVTKLDGTDVTTAFLNMLNNSSKLLTYDKVIEYTSAMGLTAGKQYFKIDYKVEAGTYPERSASFAFTMNNEIPNITCSIAPGETTTKGFTISYNASIIYDQVGECMIYINDTCYVIDENSVAGLSTIEITQKANGTGDYYVSLQTSSGNVISSFKVIIKEPLNVWAIIIIVVAVAAVSAVVITIIVLRNKMKIR